MRRVLPFIILICAIGLSASAAFYSILGLSMLFVGVRIPVMIMGGFLELSKIVSATLLHTYWLEISKTLRADLVSALVVLSLITSAGIYGLLSQGYQSSANELEVADTKIASLELKRDRFDEILTDYSNEKSILDKSISDLRTGIATGTVNQYKDKETGQIITTSSSAARKTFEAQLKSATEEREELVKKMNTVNDSITAIDMKILDIKTVESASAEIGPLKYISELLRKPTNTVINWFIVLIIFVFDPLAISLVISASFAFSKHIKRETVKVVEQTAPEREVIIEQPLPEEIIIHTNEPEVAVIEEQTVVETEPVKNSQKQQMHHGPNPGPYL